MVNVEGGPHKWYVLGRRLPELGVRPAAPPSWHGPSPSRAGHRRSGPPRHGGSWAPREQVLASRSGKRGARLRRRRRGLL